MHRRDSLQLTKTFLAAPTVVHATDRKHNGLFVAVDDLSPAMGSYSDKLSQTPKLCVDLANPSLEDGPEHAHPQRGYSTVQEAVKTVTGKHQKSDRPRYSRRYTPNETELIALCFYVKHGRET